MSGPYRVPAITAVARILESLSVVDDDGTSQAQLVRETGISKSSMHNLLGTLEAEGYVHRHARTRRYRVGGSLIALGAVAARQIQSIPLAVDLLPVLAADHGVSAAVALVTPAGDAQVINRAYPAQSVHVGIRVGSRYGYFDGAIGKCLLAVLSPDSARALVLARPIPAHTDRTVTKPHDLLTEIELVRERNWGASIGEFNSNIAVASTIFNADGKAEAILLALGFPNDLARDSVPAIGRALSDEAAFITQHAGGAPAGRATSPGGAHQAPPGGKSPKAQSPNNGGTRDEQFARS